MANEADQDFCMDAAEAAEHLRRNPRALATAQLDAARLRDAAKARCPAIAGAIDVIWAEARHRTSAVALPPQNGGPCHSPVAVADSNGAQLLIAAGVVAVFSDLAALTPREVAAISSPHGQIAETDLARAVLESRPGLGAWRRGREAGNAAQAEQRAAEQARAAADMPRSLLHGLRLRGVQLAVGKGGAIVVPAGTDTRVILPSEVRILAELKAEVVAVIRAEEAAARAAAEPVVIVP